MPQKNKPWGGLITKELRVRSVLTYKSHIFSGHCHLGRTHEPTKSLSSPGIDPLAWAVCGFSILYIAATIKNAALKHPDMGQLLLGRGWLESFWQHVGYVGCCSLLVDGLDGDVFVCKWFTRGSKLIRRSCLPELLRRYNEKVSGNPPIKIGGFLGKECFFFFYRNETSGEAMKRVFSSGWPDTW